MSKLFLSISSMIVAHFVMKSWHKVHEKPATKEEVYRRMKAEYEARRAAARPVITKLDTISTPREGAKMMALIDNISDFEAAYRAVDMADSMAIGRFA